MRVVETERLMLRRLTEDDAPFILALVNQPAWHRYIGDRGVRTLDDARRYVREGPLSSYARFGFGLYAAELKETEERVGICGLLKREMLDDVDIGFAFLPEHWGKGYASESAAAMLSYAKHVLGLPRVVAITAPDNAASVRVLERVGMRFERMVRLSDSEPEISLFAT